MAGRARPTCWGTGVTTTTPRGEHFVGHIPAELAGRRLDQALAALLPAYSRSRLQQWIRAGQVRVDSRRPRPDEHVRGGERVEVDALIEEDKGCLAQAIPLTLVYEDDSLLVIDKPSGLVVHPAAGNRDGTLQNALLHHAPELAALPRAGLVHRLDKDTTGLLVVARTLAAHKRLVEQLQARTVEREYQAVVMGVMTAGGTIEGAVGRHPTARTRMTVTRGGKPAVTHYRVMERYRAHTLIRVRLETGRTHQIRVHMAHIHHSLLGDTVYGGRMRLPKGCGERLRVALAGFKRQALHAERLALIHPASGERMEWHAPLPQDMARLIKALREDARDLEHGAGSGLG